MIILFKDAHEFLIFLINHINEIIVGEQSNKESNGCKVKPAEPSQPENDSSPTWINEIFQVKEKKIIFSIL